MATAGTSTRSAVTAGTRCYGRCRCGCDHRGELPEKTDKDPEWRASATYTAREVEQLISDARIPVERRVQYALKSIAALRHGEVAGLRWRHYDPTLEPLGRLVVATSYDTGRTKTEVTRRMPVHVTLAKILAAWKLSHWEHLRPARRPPMIWSCPPGT